MVEVGCDHRELSPGQLFLRFLFPLVSSVCTWYSIAPDLAAASMLSQTSLFRIVTSPRNFCLAK